MSALTWLVMLAPACAQQAPVSTEPITWAALDLKALDGTQLDAQTVEGKAVLVVNVASKCGFTPQYEGLQALYAKNKDHDFTIVGVPCNQFMGQEPGNPEEIATFCRMTYGVEFPLLDKQDVNGKNRSELYTQLVNSSVGEGRDIKWNFTKFLVDSGGNVIGRYGSSTKPDDPALLADIARALKPTEVK